MELHYIQSLPVERIINYFEAHGFSLKETTAHKLIEKASKLFENLYKCIWQTVLGDPYKVAEETYYKFGYFTDVINETDEWQPNTIAEKIQRSAS